eukprot:1157545-Pelagomonas_calceolata.AAC.6
MRKGAAAAALESQVSSLGCVKPCGSPTRVGALCCSEVLAGVGTMFQSRPCITACYGQAPEP